MRGAFGTRPFAGCIVGLAVSGCTLVSPGCRNRDVKASLESDARKSVELLMKMTGGKADNPTQGASFELKDAYETSASGDTRSCSAKMMVGDSTKQIPVPIEFQVIKGENGEALYSWDAAGFGQSFLAQAVLTAVTKGFQPTPSAAASPATQAGASAVTPPPPPTSDAAPVQRASAVRPQDSPWGEVVRSKILAQASAVAVKGSGTVYVSFDISAEGDISNVKVVRGSGNAGLDAAAVRIVEQAGHIEALYGERVVGFTMKLSFL